MEDSQIPWSASRAGNSQRVSTRSAKSVVRLTTPLGAGVFFFGGESELL